MELFWGKLSCRDAKYVTSFDSCYFLNCVCLVMESWRLVFCSDQCKSETSILPISQFLPPSYSPCMSVSLGICLRRHSAVFRSQANTELTRARPESSCLLLWITEFQDCISLIMVTYLAEISLPDPPQKWYYIIVFQWQIGLKESKQLWSDSAIVTIWRTLARVFYICSIHCCILCGQVSFL